MVNALEVINEINDRLGYPQLETIESAQTTDQRRIVTLLNRVLKSLQGLDDWPLMRKEGELVLVASVESDLTAGTEQYVAVTQNSDALTVANGTFNNTYIDRAIQVSGDEFVYRIEDVVSPTEVTLNRAWVSDSVVLADERTFKVGTDRYALPDDFDRPVGPWTDFFSAWGIQPVDPNEFKLARRHDPGVVTGNPRMYTVFGMNEAQTAQLVHFHPFPEDAAMLNFDYIQVHPAIDSDNDKILFPQRFMGIIIDMVVRLAYRDYEDDARMQVVLADMVNEFNTQVSNIGPTATSFSVRPRNQVRADIRAGIARGAFRRIDWGNYFDTVGNTGFR